MDLQRKNPPDVAIVKCASDGVYTPPALAPSAGVVFWTTTALTPKILLDAFDQTEMWKHLYRRPKRLRLGSK